MDGAASEADARLRLIDRVLVEVLGWHQNQLSCEPNGPNGFADYIATDGVGRNLWVLEAKRQKRLALNTAVRDTIEVTLGGSVLANLRSAVDQTVNYCSDHGVSYGTVTDGNTWAFFRATRSDGIPPLQGKAIVFPSLDAIAADFPRFYELASREGIGLRLHLVRLNTAEGIVARPVEPRHYIRPPSSAHLQARAPISRDIIDIFKKFFSSMSADRDRDMRVECFVETNESREADTTLAKITATLTSLIEPLETEQGAALHDEIQSVIDSKNSEVCLIVGNKGSGKSTFIDRFFDETLPPSTRNHCVVGYVDLSLFMGDVDDLPRWLSARLRDALEDSMFNDVRPDYDDYMGMFFSVYQRWSTGTHKYLYEGNRDAFKQKFGDYVESLREDRPEEYVVGLMQHAVGGRRKLPCIVFDNTDQRLPEIQDAVFQYAIALRNETLCFSLVPITDRSMWRLSKAGALQSYVSRTFYLPSPPAKEVLARRIAYVQRKLETDESVSKQYFSAKGIRISISDLGAFVNILEEAFVRNDQLSNIIGRLANYDIRRMLLLAQQTITSPTFKIEDLIRAYVDRGNRPFDLNRAMRAMIIGEYDRYTNQTNDFIMNVFWTDGSFSYTPLLVLSILIFLRALRVSEGEHLENSYMSVVDIENFFEPAGIGREEVRDALARLMSFRLVEPFEPADGPPVEGTRVGITYSGLAHMELALDHDVYVEQMAVATGFASESIRDLIGVYARKMGLPENRAQVRALFRKHVGDEDARKAAWPSSPAFRPMVQLRDRMIAASQYAIATDV